MTGMLTIPGTVSIGATIKLMKRYQIIDVKHPFADHFSHVLYVIRLTGNWELVWSDEFNGDLFNDSEWKYSSGAWTTNNELQYYASNTRVEKGHLIIEAKAEEKDGRHFTSARLTSKKAWTYGKFECRARLPKGKHLWPAIWLMPQNNEAASGEIDIMEYRGQRTDTIAGALHYGGVAPDTVSKVTKDRKFSTDFSATFHTFGLTWDKNHIKWFLDGNEFHTENINRDMWSGNGTNPYKHKGEPYNKDFHWILNIAVGGKFFPEKVFGPQVTASEATKWEKPTMEVDWLRVYQQKSIAF
ncbi:unnamed protein product [Oppiella nova]|uniref:GH16 domain-containing protein n=1 Tax=Oppiella nova TaxID=334625 RepID=A0A7R9MAT8_9ACAR|nr:unnamed protein product [Oppiella nova]CAG2173983.1 unnamed protein product [Oppiella nova]